MSQSHNYIDNINGTNSIYNGSYTVPSITYVPCYPYEEEWDEEVIIIRRRKRRAVPCVPERPVWPNELPTWPDELPKWPDVQPWKYDGPPIKITMNEPCMFDNLPPGTYGIACPCPKHRVTC